MPISKKERDQNYVNNAEGPLQRLCRVAETSYPPEHNEDKKHPLFQGGKRAVSIKVQGPTAYRGFGSRKTVAAHSEGQ